MYEPVELEHSRRPTVVLLGASNLTRGIATVIPLVRRIVAQPCDIVVAHGHGRSFGQQTRVLGRSLPGILMSGLWHHLDRAERRPVLGLICDVGNDLIYGVTVDELTGWIEQAVNGLSARGASVSLGLLPMETVRSLSAFRFQLFRSLLFPSSSVEYETVLAQAEQLTNNLVQLAHDHGVQTVEMQPEWYGVDPIHIQMKSWAAAWSAILATWAPEEIRRPELERIGKSVRPWSWAVLRTRTPAARTLFGVAQGVPQPCMNLKDGTTISFY